MFYQRTGVQIRDVFLSRPPSEGELREQAAAFTRQYPDVIKGNWEPSSFHMAKMLREDAERIKTLGVNTVSVSAEYEVRKDGSFFMRDERTLFANIVNAKEAGFSVLVAPNFVGPSGHKFAEEGIALTLEEYLRMSEEVALKWAEIAEMYRAEFFAPQNEFNGMVRGNFADTDAEAAEIVSQWHEDMLPKVKAVFGGKTMAKLDYFISEDMRFPGYDYVGITVSHGGAPLEHFARELPKQYALLARIAEASGADWLISEAWFPYGGPFYPQTANRNGQPFDDLQDDYFRVSIDAYRSVEEPKAAGYIFIAWIMPGMDVKDRPAETVLKEFFSSP